MAEIDTLIAKINKRMGGPVLIRGSDLKDREILRVTTGSLAFDLVLGGGWPLNAWNEIIGQESHGKTVMAIKTIAANQALNPDHESLWIASEDFNYGWATALGMDLSRVTFGLTNVMEEAYDICIETLDERAVDALVIDSLPALVPTEESEKSMMEFTVALGAKLTNKFMRKSNTAQRRSMIEDDRPCLGIIVNQWRDKIGTIGHADPRTTPGGKGKNFHYFTRVEVAREEWLTEGTLKVGQRIKARGIKNKTAPPQRVGSVDFYFHDSGPFTAGTYDVVKEITAVAMASDVLEQKGAWYHFGGEKWNGKERVLEAMREEPRLREAVEAEVRHLVLGTPLPRKRVIRKK